MIHLQKEQAYRVHDPVDIIYLTLLDGTAEIFGRELLLVRRLAARIRGKRK